MLAWNNNTKKKNCDFITPTFILDCNSTSSIGMIKIQNLWIFFGGSIIHHICLRYLSKHARNDLSSYVKKTSKWRVICEAKKTYVYVNAYLSLTQAIY